MSSPARILFAGRLLYWTGPHLALAAFDRIYRELPDAQFTIVGSGPEKARSAEAKHRIREKKAREKSNAPVLESRYNSLS
jgi:glycosyltransferase involved in cell wall biosynthesis